MSFKKIKNLMASLSNAIYQETRFEKSPFETEDLFKKKIDQEVKNATKELITKMKKGVELIEKQIEERGDDAVIEWWAEAQQKLKEATGKVKLRDCLSEELLDAIESWAEEKYKEKLFEDSLSLYFYLCQVNPLQTSYLIGYANSLFMQSRYLEAERYYNLALFSNPEDPVIQIFYAYNAMAQQKTEDAQEMWEMVERENSQERLEELADMLEPLRAAFT